MRDPKDREAALSALALRGQCPAAREVKPATRQFRQHHLYDFVYVLKPISQQLHY